jgi:hypothetical protein
MPEMLEVRTIDRHWDRANNRFVVQVGLSNGRKVGIAFPMGHMHIALDESLSELGYYEPCQMGEEYETIGSFFGRIKKLVKKVGRKISRSAIGKVYSKTIGKAEHLALTVGRKLARSKAVGAIAGAAATVFPAVGGPALAAWTVANRAMAIKDKADRAAALLRRGIKNPKLLAQVAQGKRVQQTIANAAKSRSPFGGLIVQSLKSVA